MTGININCESCGKIFQRKRPQFLAWVCPYCYKMHDAEEAAVDLQLPVPEDMTLLSLDSTLEIEGSRYVFVGRYHYRMLNAYKNNWVLSNEKGEQAYLIEAKGYYAFCKELANGLAPNEPRQLVTGNDMFLNNRELYVDEVDKNEVTFYEGELPQIGRHGSTFFAAEMSNNQGDYAFVRLFDKKQSTVYLGKYGAFSDFKLHNTRSAHDWK